MTPAASTHQGFQLPLLRIFQLHLLGRILAAELLDVRLQAEDEAASAAGTGKEHLWEWKTKQLLVGLKCHSDTSGYFPTTLFPGGIKI